MRRILFLALLLSVSLPTGTLAQSGAKGKTRAQPAKSKQLPKAPTELEKTIAERDRLIKAGKLKEALPMAERVVALLRQARAESLDLALALRTIADMQSDLQMYPESDKNFGDAIALFQRLKKGESLEAARTWFVWGFSSSSRGDLDLAKKRYEAALVIREKLAPGSLNVANTLYNLGVVAYNRGDLNLAQKRYEAALAIYEQVAPGSSDVANTLYNLGVVAYNRGDLDLTQKRYEAAFAIQQKLAPGSLDLAASLNNLGNVAKDWGDLELAQNRYEAALAIYRRLTPDSLDAAMSLNNLGNVAWNRGDLDFAQKRYEAALAIYEKLAPGSLSLANSLNNLGNVAGDRGDLDLAQKWYEAALTIYEKLAPGSLSVATSLNNLGTVALNRGDLDLAQKRHEAALTIYEKLAPGSAGVAMSLNNLGNVASNRGDLDLAQKWYEAALTIYEKLAPGSLSVATSLNNLGTVAIDRGELDLAQKRHEAALAIREKLAPDSLDVAMSLNSLGNVAWNRGDLDLAQKWYEAALAIREKRAPGSLDVAHSLNNLGTVASDRGDLDLAQKCDEAALAIYEKLAPDSLDVAMSLSNLGAVANDRGDLDLAQKCFEAALAIQENLAPGSLGVALSLNNLGTMAVNRGDLDQAQKRIEAALAIHEKLAPGSLVVAQSLNGLGRVANDRGDLDLAENRYAAALDIQEKLAPGSLGMAQSLNGLGRVANDRGDLDCAQKRFEAALAIRENVATGSLDVAASLNNLGLVAYKHGDLDLAQKRHEAALAIYKKLAPGSPNVVDSLNNMGAVARGRKEGTKLTGLQQELLQTVTKLLEAQGSSQGGNLGSLGTQGTTALMRLGFSTDPTGFYSYLPALRGAGLTLKTRYRASQRVKETDPNVQTAFTAVQVATKQETDWVTNPRPKQMAEKTWNDHLLDLRSKRQSAELTLAALLKEKDPRLGEVLKVELTDVQKAIPADSALIEFLRINAWDDKSNKQGLDAYGAFIVRREGPVKYVRLGDAENIDKKVRQFMALIDGESSTDRAQAVGSRTTSTKGPSRTELGKELYRQVIAPLGKLPANLQIAPDGSLHTLAFDALQYRSGKYLLELKNVSLVGSGRDLAVKPPSAPTTEPVVFGVGTFNADLAAHGQAVKTVAAKLDPPTTVSRGNRGGSVWGSLPGAVAEAKEVAAQLNVKPILDSEAIEERLLSTKNPKVLHLATHGFSFPPAFEAPKRDRMEMMGMGDRIGSADNPMLRSGIVLAGASDEEKLREAGYQDGWVTALDLSLMDLRGTELVVLSACDTGLGDVRQSEGVFGLQRALKFAGAQTLIMSLFEVPDASTEQLMASFYGAWKPGSPAGSKQQALRNAKLELLKDPKTRSPKNWAGFVLLGDR